MKRIPLVLKDEKGIALVVALLFLTLLSLLGIAGIITSSTDTKIAGNTLSSTKALYIAEAGLTRAEAELINDLNNDQNIANSSFAATSGAIDITPGSTAFYTVFNSISFGAGSYTIQFKNYGTAPNYESAIVLVRSTGTGPNSSTVTLERYLSAENISPWNNAIFAGAGATGATINGNADIRGSVHILGTGLTSTNFAVNMSGGALIGNNYNGMDDALKALIPSIGATEDLEAKLRVKQGKVGLSGTAQVGKSETTSTNKDTVGGVYVTDGYGGTAGASNVYSDNGTSNAYDLGDKVTFPSLNNPYTDPTTGTNYSTYAAFLTANAYIYSGDLNISDDTPTFTIGNANGSITWDKSAATLTISGLVKAGNIDLAKKGKVVTYAGKGTLYSTGNIKIHDNLLPSSGFPATNAIGLIATQDIEIATVPGESHTKAAGAFYAEGKIKSGMQNKILGTFVSNYFDMGSQVPKIYQVPSLATNLPPGMPGATPVWVFTKKTWREITKD